MIIQIKTLRTLVLSLYVVLYVVNTTNVIGQVSIFEFQLCKV